MVALADAVLILILLGTVAPMPTGGLIPAVWLAFVTPCLVRSDLSRRRLPNFATVPALGLVLSADVAAFLVDTGVQDPAPALLVTVLVAGVGFVSARRGGVGLGDVKLAAAVVGSAALVRIDAAWSTLFVAGLAGGAVALGARWRRWKLARRGWCGGVDGGPTGQRVEIPYGPCLLFGYWVALVTASVV